MTEPVLVRELEEIRDSLRDGFRGVHDRLDAVNGRLRDNESAVCVLEDRSERTERILGALPHGIGRWTPKRAAQVGGAGVGGAAVLLGLIELAKTVLPQLWK